MLALILLATAASGHDQHHQQRPLLVSLRTQRLSVAAGRKRWVATEAEASWAPNATAFVVVDMWEDMPCLSATYRIQALAVLVNRTVAAARARGAHIIFAPSMCGKSMEHLPARQYVLGLKNTPPPPLPAACGAPSFCRPPLPITANATNNRGCDGFRREDPSNPATFWPRSSYCPQTAALTIEDEDAVVEDNEQEIWNVLVDRKIQHVVYMGVHENMCIMGRSFAIVTTVSWGLEVALLRDLTDSMYDPEDAPYVTHEEGTALMTGYIEKFWVPTLSFYDLVLSECRAGGPAGCHAPTSTAAGGSLKSDDDGAAAITVPDQVTAVAAANSGSGTAEGQLVQQLRARVAELEAALVAEQARAQRSVQIPAGSPTVVTCRSPGRNQSAALTCRALDNPAAVQVQYTAPRAVNGSYTDALLYEYTLRPDLAQAPPGNVTIAVWSTGSGTTNAAATIAAAQAAAARAAARGADLVLFSEAFFFDGSNAELVPGGPTLAIFHKLAEAHQMYLAVPLMEKTADGHQYNTVALIDRTGSFVGKYRKVNPCAPGCGDDGVTPPSDGVGVFETDFGRVAILTCFDAQFPEVWQQAAAAGADLVLWPSAYGGGRPIAAYAALYNYPVVLNGMAPQLFVDVDGAAIELQHSESSSQDGRGSAGFEYATLALATLDLDRAVVSSGSRPCGDPRYQGYCYTAFLKEHAGKVVLERSYDAEGWWVLRSIAKGFSVRKQLRAKGLPASLREARYDWRQELNILRAAGVPRPQPPPAPPVPTPAQAPGALGVYLAVCNVANENQTWIMGEPGHSGQLQLQYGGCVSNIGCSTLSPGCYLTVVACNKSSPFQQYTFDPRTGFVHAASTKCNGGPNCCVNVNGGGSAGSGASSGAMMDVYQCQNGGAASLELMKSGSAKGAHQLQLKASKAPKLCLTAVEPCAAKFPAHPPCFVPPAPAPPPAPPPGPPSSADLALVCGLKTLALEYAKNALRSGSDLKLVTDALCLEQECPTEFAALPSQSTGQRKEGGASTRVETVKNWMLQCVHVSEGGHDGASADGSLAHPFRSLGYALSECRARHCRCIELHNGLYELRETLSLGPADSNLVIRSPPNETAVISGGRQLEVNFRRHHGQVFVADLPADVKPSSTLTFEGARQIKARYPNGNPETTTCNLFTDGTDCQGFVQMSGALPLFNLSDGQPNCTGYYEKLAICPDATMATAGARWINMSSGPWDDPTKWDAYPWVTQYWYMMVNGSAARFNPPVSPSADTALDMEVSSGLLFDDKFSPRVAAWTNVKDAAVQMWPADDHRGFVVWRINEVSTDSAGGGSIAWKFGEGGWQQVQGPVAGERMNKDGNCWFAVENVLQELDMPGEYYHDAAAHKLYYWPNTTRVFEGGSLQVTLGGLEVVVAVNGTDSRRVENVTLDGLEFAHSGQSYLTQPYEVPSNGDFAVRRAAAVFVENAKGFTITGCKFERPGGNGLMLSNHVRFANVSFNEVAFAGENAIVLMGTSSLNSGLGIDSYPSDNFVGHNHLHHFGVWGKNSAGFLQAVGTHNTIVGNVIHSGPRSGATFNDHFGGGNKFAGNLMFDLVRETSDHGPFKSWSRMPYVTDRGASAPEPGVTPATSILSHNFIFSDHCASDAIYFDDGSDYWNATDNVIAFGPIMLMWHGTNKNVERNLIIRSDLDRSHCNNAGCINVLSNDAGAKKDPPFPSYRPNETATGNVCILERQRMYSQTDGCHVENPAATSVFGGNNSVLTSDTAGMLADFFVCGETHYSLTEWQALWPGGDRGTVVKPKPTNEAVVAMARAKLFV